MLLDRTSYQGETLGVELPVTVDLLVTETEPGFAGDTADRAPARPRRPRRVSWSWSRSSSNEGDTIRIDTRTGEYQTRV